VQHDIRIKHVVRFLHAEPRTRDRCDVISGDEQREGGGGGGVAEGRTWRKEIERVIWKDAGIVGARLRVLLARS